MPQKKKKKSTERLARIDPNDVEVALGLTGAYLSDMHPALALRAGQRFLERWPDHPRAAELVRP